MTKNYKNPRIEQLPKSLLVFGSRTLSGKRIRDIIYAEIEKYDIDYIITALEPHGVCQEARNILMSSEMGLTFVAYTKDGKKARGMHDHRSRAAIYTAERGLFIWDGNSRGTKHEIDLAEKAGLPFQIITLKPFDLTDIDWDL